MKKILLLGGSAQQVIAIETAKRMGLYTVLCDYLTDNPGQFCADRFYLVSTTDKEAVLKTAREENVDGICAYASDPAAPAAAYAAQEMGLPGNPYESVEILCDKEKFRTFQHQHGFMAPVFRGYADAAKALRDIEEGVFHFPVMVKPVDSSGSKGVSRIDSAEEAEEKLENAMRFSRAGRIVAEEYVEPSGFPILGEGLSVGGKLVFSHFADHRFDRTGGDPFVPVSGAFPASLPEEVLGKIRSEIQRLLDLLSMKNAAYNFEVRVDDRQNIYLMEAAPRNGGNYIPDVIRYLTGVDMVECTIKGAMGETSPDASFGEPAGFYAYYVVHSQADGVLERIEVDRRVREENILEEHINVMPGGEVQAFTGANKALGVYVMKFRSREQMTEMLEHPEKWIRVVLQN